MTDSYDAYNDDDYIKGKLATINRYLERRDIGKFIMLDAGLAMSSAKDGWARDRRPAVGRFEQKYIHIYAEVNDAVNAIALKGKEWELTHWMGFAPDDVKELLKLRQEWDDLVWEDADKERREMLRDLWGGDCLSEDYLKPWQPYFDRRTKKALVETHDRDSFSGETERAKIMIGGSAGRVLLTIQDLYKHGDPKASFDGGMVTLIFDGTSKVPRGGVQSLCCTRDEGLGLVQEAIDHMPTLVEDQEIFIA